VSSIGEDRAWADKGWSRQCDRCQTPMGFVTTILDSKASSRVRLFECQKCQLTALIPELSPHSRLSWPPRVWKAARTGTRMSNHSDPNNGICHTWRLPSVPSIVRPFQPAALFFFRSRMTNRASSRAAASSELGFFQVVRRIALVDRKSIERHVLEDIGIRLFCRPDIERRNSLPLHAGQALSLRSFSQVTNSERTPFSRLLASVIGGPL
jgi:hypothetical protein